MPNITVDEVHNILVSFLNDYTKNNQPFSILEAKHIRQLYELIINTGYPSERLSHIMDSCPEAFGDKFKRDTT